MPQLHQLRAVLASLPGSSDWPEPVRGQERRRLWRAERWGLRRKAWRPASVSDHPLRRTEAGSLPAATRSGRGHSERATLRCAHIVVDLLLYTESFVETAANVVNVADTVDNSKIGPFQVGMLVLCSLCL